MPVDWSKYGGTATKTERRSASRVDWSKYDPDVIAENKRQEGLKIRSATPEAFNPFQQQKAVTSFIDPGEKKEVFGPPVPSDLGVKRRQQAAMDAPLTKLAQSVMGLSENVTGNLVNKLIPQKTSQNIVSSAKDLTNVPDIPGITTANPVTNFIRGAGDMASLGLSSYIDRVGGNVEAAEGATQTTAGKAGQFAGAFALPAGRLKQGASLISNIGRGATAGAILGTGMEGGEILTGRNDQSLGERALNVGVNTLAGGAGAGVVLGLGKGVGALANRLNRNRVTNEATQEVLALPAPRDSINASVEAPDFPQMAPNKGIQEAVENISPQRITPEAEVDSLIREIQTPRKRDRVYNWLDEQEQAARKRIAGRRGYLNSNPLPEWGDMTIIGAAKMGKGSIKAADWTEEMVKEFGEQFRPIAQRAYVASKEALRKQERLASKEGMQADAFNNSGSGDAGSFNQKINRNISKKKTPFTERIDKIRTQLIDDLAPLESLENRVAGRLESAEDSLYKTARLYRGTPEKASQIVTTRLSPIIQNIEKAGNSADDLGMYALAMHAKDVNAAGYKSGFTNAEIDDVLSKYGSDAMKAAQQELVKINRDMMQELVDNGVVSKQLADTLNERWQNYVPLFRAFDDNKVEFGSGLSSALANVSSPIKSLQGSERAVIDPLENMVKNIFQSVNAAERNKVAGQLAKLATKDKESKFIRKIEDKYYVTVRENGGYKRYAVDRDVYDSIPGMEKLQKHELAKSLSNNPDATFARTLSEKDNLARKNVVNVKVDGENIKYEVEPEVYKALLNLDQESSNMLINVLSKPASLLRAGATLTPEFSLRNPMRDVLQAYVTSNSGFNPITDFGAGLIQSISKGKLYRDWIENSGAYGNIISQDRNVHRQALEKVLKEPVSKKFVNVVNGKSLINVLRAITDTTESATKVGEYRAALRQGQSKQEAAYRSRDVMDFGRAGTSIRQTNKVVAFLNANIQGKSKLLRALKENPVGVTARAFTSITVPTISIYAINETLANDIQKQTIAEAPDWQKDSFWLIAIPGTDQVARIPKPFDLAPIFANLPEKALQYVRDNDKEAFDGFIQRTAKSMSLPSQLSGLLPFIEGMANYSFFREGSIIPQAEQRREFKDQYDPVRTTETAKLLAAGAEKLTGGKGALKNFSSPRIMDNTIKGLTAGLGTYATSAIDAILKGVGAVDRPASPEKRAAQQPLAKAFLVDPLQGGRSMDKFYTELEELEKQKSSAGINEQPFKKEGRYKYLSDVSSTMSDINKEIRRIEASDLTAKEKRDKIDPLIQRRNKLAQDAVNK